MLFSHGTFCFLTGDESLKVQQKTPGFMAVSHFHFPSVFDCSFSQIQLFFFSLSRSLYTWTLTTVVLWVVVPLVKRTGREPGVQLQPSGDVLNGGSQKHLRYYVLVSRSK